MPVALVIGASRGIGREFVQQLLHEHWRVYATARNDSALSALQTAGATALRVDVTQPETLAALGWQLDGAELDLVVHAAGIYGPASAAVTPPTAADFNAVMQVNVLGAMQVIPLLAPMVEAAHGKFIFLTSRMGSIGDAQSSSGWIYRASKAALNMAVHSAAFDYPAATFAVLSPGWVRTDMGGPQATLSVTDSVSKLRAVINALQPGQSGAFLDHAGLGVPW